ncbi:MAG: tRNA (adenosine(37)-N6)-threonylcarbamoyltransferase complex transferase subunit TsaD [Puniceicoccaceae bacterium]
MRHSTNPVEHAAMILGVESSCDESAVACFCPTAGLSHEYICSQLELHASYGGVVPDLASREHLENFFPLLERLRNELDFQQVQQIAVTRGPGLAACLAMGITLAKALALSLDLPLVGVNHLQGHAYSPFIPLHAADPSSFRVQLHSLLPHLGLIVSGGNTLLIRIDTSLRISILAETVDDAAGEAIDKGAKLLGLAYPGGPVIEKLARSGGPAGLEFPVSFPNPKDLRFSFSGLKTSLRYTLEKMDDATVEQELPNLCYAYQGAVVHQLIRKTRHVLSSGDWKSIGLSGGVSNNGLLRNHFEALGRKHKVPVLMAERKHTGDNASMIAFAAWMQPDYNLPDSREQSLTFDPSLRVDAAPTEHGSAVAK